MYRGAEGVEQLLVLDRLGETSIGRHPECTITVAQPSVSRRHARLWFEGGGFYVEDLKSSNGTYVNNQRVTRASLAPGDELRCGDFKLSYSEESNSGTLEAPSPSLREPPPSIPPAPPISGAPGAKPRVVGTLRPRRRGTAEEELPDFGEGPKAGTTPPRKPITPRPVGRISRPPTRSERAKRPASQAPAPAPAPAPVADVGTLDGRLDALNVELEAAQAQAIAAEQARDEALAKMQGLEESQAEEAGDAARRVKELEAARLHNEEQIETLTERALRLKEQVQTQQAQLEEYRQEKVLLEVQVAESREDLQGLESANQASSRRESELADAINDLKREVRQRDKGLKDVERQLDLAEYNLRAAREENENLRLALGEDDDARKGMNTTIDHLRQVLAEKEAMIESLHTDLGRVEGRLGQAEAGADERADELARRNADLADELEAAKRQLSERGDSRRAQQQLNELKRENRELRHALQAATPADPGELEALREALAEAQSAQKMAERAAAAAAAQIDALQAQPAAGGGDFEALRKAAVSTYESLNDVASELRMNMELATGYLGDLKPLLDMAATLALRGQGELQAIQALAKEVDVDVTVESAEETLTSAQDAADTFKRLMRRFREVLQRHGYGA